MTWSMHVTYLILTYLLMMEHFYLKISVVKPIKIEMLTIIN